MSDRKDKPWLDEPDAVDFTHRGLNCAMRRGPLKHWCGYVSVPEGHPLYGVGYSDQVSNPPRDRVERAISVDSIGAITMFTASIGIDEEANSYRLDLLLDAHGGLTFARGKISGQGDISADWWLGFDCAHAGDLCPDSSIRSDGVYRDEAYVKSICVKLADQIADWVKS